MIANGQVNSTTEFSQFIKSLQGNEKYSKDFFDLLYKSEDGKEFVLSEFTATVE